MFEPGDKVICIDGSGSSGSRVGATYTVTEVGKPNSLGCLVGIKDLFGQVTYVFDKRLVHRDKGHPTFLLEEVERALEALNAALPWAYNLHSHVTGTTDLMDDVCDDIGALIEDSYKQLYKAKLMTKGLLNDS